MRLWGRCGAALLTLAVLQLFACAATGGQNGGQNQEQSEEERVADEQAVAEIFAGHGPISNLYDEGFRPVPGMRGVYYLPGSDIMVRCGDSFRLNLSMKRTFDCYHVDRGGARIAGTDFVVQINPWQGDDGFSPYRESPGTSQ